MPDNKKNTMSGGPMPGKPPKKVDKRTMKRLMAYLLDYPLLLALVVAGIIIAALATAASSLFLQSLIDDYISPLLLASEADYSGLLRALMMMAIIYIVGVISTYMYNRLMVIIAQGVLKRIRDNMFSHMQTLPIKYFDSHSHGDIMSHYTNDADTLRQMLTQSLPQLFSSVITIVAVLFSMMYLSIPLTAFAVIMVILIVRAAGIIVKKSGKYFIEQQKSLGDVNGYIEEMISGLKVVKVFNHESVVTEEFDEKNEQLCENATLANKFANILMPIMNNFGYILYVLIAIVGGMMAIAGSPNIALTGTGVLSLGMIASFLQLSRSFVMPIAQVSQQMNAVVMAFAGAERIFELMDQASEADEGYVTLVNMKQENGEWVETKERTAHWAWKHPHTNGELTYKKLTGEVEIFDMDFGYVADKLVLNNITMDAKSGEKIAFVGATGAGKTTITNLINRFYDIDDGKIRYDGININKIRKEDLRRSLGIVLQDVHLFTGTVMENIRYGRLDATDEECIEAAKLANAHDFIEMLPDGYKTELNAGGSGLSQGQRQLLSIARAAVADPPVMILDEATSSIDTRTESIVSRGMDALMKGRTVFVIAHRLSTIKNADAIMVLEHGQIIERGNHDELIEKKGEYYQLYTGALELS